LLDGKSSKYSGKKDVQNKERLFLRYISEKSASLTASIAFVIPQRQKHLGQSPKTHRERTDYMRKRTVHFQLWLSEKEAEKLTKLAKKSGYSRTAYLRSLLDGYTPQPMPPPDYHAMMRELHYIGHNLNQIAQKAHITNNINDGRYDKAVEQFIEGLTRIEEAVILPKKRE